MVQCRLHVRRTNHQDLDRYNDEPSREAVGDPFRLVGAFPDGSSCLNLTAARLRHIAGTQWSTRCYMNMARLKEAKMATYGAAVA